MDPSPIAIVHGQPSPGNLVQRPDGSVTLLDWDESGTGPIALDLGYPLICVLLTEKPDWREDRARAFYRGYRDRSTGSLPSPDDVFAAALLHGMRSAMFANQTARLRRVRYALNEGDRLIRAFTNTA